MLKVLAVIALCVSSWTVAANSLTKNAIEVAREKGNYTSFIELVEQAGLTKTIEEASRVTIFIPSDAAFAKLDSATLNYLANNQEVLKQVLLYHVGKERMSASDVAQEKEIKTLAGKTVTVDVNSGNVVLNKESSVTQADVISRTNYLHFIDSVLIFNDKTANNEFETADFVDLERYLGQWYEVARYDNSFQEDCLGTRATYGKKGPYVIVLNECQRADGTMSKGRALATIKNKETNAELAVSFVPVLNFFGLFSGDYNILAVGDDYEYALVGSKSRDTFWILSRTRAMSDQKLNSLIDLAVEKGFRRELIKKRPVWQM